ncbi:PadR family transcriptional regulator [Liquorilactobacillus satsumensis]|nr:PadR family transcriptional regulator [Liquorilactobacillus satsumensis]
MYHYDISLRCIGRGQSMYEFFVLSELMDEPLSGYKLQFVLQKIVGNSRKISFGVIYPLLDKLAKGGLIKVRLADTQLKRKKKIASITPQGKQRFLELMQEPIEINQNTDFMYKIKFGSFHHVSQALTLTILYQYQQYLTNDLRTLRQNKQELSKQGMQPGDLKDTQRVFELRELHLLAGLSWTEQQLREKKNAETK